MRILHTADLHIGKMLNEWDLLDDTKHVLGQVCQIAEREKVDLVVLAGDIFDRSVPSDRALKAYGDFLSRLINDDHLRVLAIAGNHDSDVRLGAYGSLLERSGYMVASRYEGRIVKVPLSDEFGTVVFWLLPFFQPAEIKTMLGLEKPLSQFTDNEAFKAILAREKVDQSVRNVMVMHQFVAGYEPSGSEEPGLAMAEVAGLSNIAVNNLAPFDYVALGHVHRPESIGRKTIRYSGSLLGYKISECGARGKSVTIVDLKQKGDVGIKEVPIVPLHPLREVSGTFDQIMGLRPDRESFVFVHLLDENVVNQAANRLAAVFPRYLSIDYPNQKPSDGPLTMPQFAELDPIEFLKEFYRERTGRDLKDQDLDLVRKVLDGLGKEDPR